MDICSQSSPIKQQFSRDENPLVGSLTPTSKSASKKASAGVVLTPVQDKENMTMNSFNKHMKSPNTVEKKVASSRCRVVCLQGMLNCVCLFIKGAFLIARTAAKAR
jgi:hypothetical protein